MTKLSPTFYKKLSEMSSRLGMNPLHILAVMTMESGLNPHVPSTAAGLIQILPKYLKNFGYQGSAQDFRNESAETQLDTIEKVIKSQIQYNGGKPFKSLSQYYVANFIPAALKLPGIQQEDPNTIIVSADPDRNHIPNVSIKDEKLFYDSNKGLDANRDGNITYGDIKSKMNNILRNPVYLQAVKELQEYTNTNFKEEIPEKTEEISTPVKSVNAPSDNAISNYIKKHKDIDVFEQLSGKPPTSKPAISQVAPMKNLELLLDKFLQGIQASEIHNKKLYKSCLPNNDILIQINSKDPVDSIEFARILCTALDEECFADCYTYVNDQNVEVECNIAGSKQECFDAVKQLTLVLQQTFKDATKKIGGININTNLIINKKSSYQQITGKMAELNYRKFIFKFA